MNELFEQKEKVRQLIGLLEITTDAEDRRRVREILIDNQLRLILGTIDRLIKSLAGAGVAAREKMLPPAR